MFPKRESHPRRPMYGFAFALLFLFAAQSHAENFLVTTDADSGPGSFREALELANANPGPDVIDFAFQGVIRPNSLLPEIEDQTGGTTIHGQGITLDGQSGGEGGAEGGLAITSADNVVEGLTIVRCGYWGMVIANSSAHGNIVRGCKIGTDGVQALGNGSIGLGIWFYAHDNQIGGPNPGDGNIVSGNQLEGILFFLPSSNNRIQGNFIGTDSTGCLPIPNGGSGIVLTADGVENNLIGGKEEGAENRIAFNAGYGILFAGSNSIPAHYPAQNSIYRNAIFDNVLGGIKTDDNNPLSVAAPVISGLGPVAGTAANRAYIEFFVDDGAQGRQYIGFTYARENGQFSAELDLSPYEGKNLTATATDSSGNTSGFSEPVEIAAEPFASPVRVARLVGRTYQPGEPLDILLLAEFDNADKMTTFSHQELPPEGWVVAGHEEEMETRYPEDPYVYFLVPVFSDLFHNLSVHYQLIPPIGDTAAAEIYGYSEARENSGAFYTPSFVSIVRPAEGDPSAEIEPSPPRSIYSRPPCAVDNPKFHLGGRRDITPCAQTPKLDSLVQRITWWGTLAEWNGNSTVKAAALDAPSFTLSFKNSQDTETVIPESQCIGAWQPAGMEALPIFRFTAFLDHPRDLSDTWVCISLTDDSDDLFLWAAAADNQEKMVIIPFQEPGMPLSISLGEADDNEEGLSEGEGSPEGGGEGVLEGEGTEEGGPEGTLDGEIIPEGAVEGEGTEEGGPEGTLDGEIIPEGTVEGEGTEEGGPEGTLDGEIIPEGAVEGEGAEEGGPEGTLDGEIIPEGAVEGEGTEEGGPEGTLDGEIIPEGAAEGEGLEEGTAEGIPEAEVEGEGCNPSQCSADVNFDNEISLNELTRVIQFFNTQGLHCAEFPKTTEDGYEAGPGEKRDCCIHSSDYNPQDWRISLTELIRVIQFFYMDGYHACPDGNTEDGFCPGLAE